MIVQVLIYLIFSGVDSTTMNVPVPFQDLIHESQHFTSDNGTGDFFYKFRVHLEDEPDDYEVTRTVRTRPESPAAIFEMKAERVSNHNLSGNKTSLSDAQQVATSEGVGSNARSVFYRSLKGTWQRSAEAVDSKIIKIDPNYDIRSGGWTVRRYGYDIWYSDVHIQLYKKTASGGEEKVGSEQIIEMYEYWIPVPLINEKFYPDVALENSAYEIPEGFGGIKFSDTHANLLGIGGTTFPRISLSTNIYGNMGMTTNATTYRNDVLKTLPKRLNNFSSIVGFAPKKIDDMLNAVAGQGSSMNSLRVPGDLPRLDNPSCGSQLTMPPGTIWLPDKPGYQAMVGTTPMSVSFPMFANSNGGRFTYADGRTHCLNMELKEPAPGVRYFPYMSNDPILDALAEMTNASRMRGPWDQVRTWIYTDKIGLDDANERISPPITEAQYLNGLFEVFRLGGIKSTDIRNTKMFSPKLLMTPYSDNKAFAWFSMHICEKAGKSVRSWLESSSDGLIEMILTPADEFQTRHPARLFSALLTSVDKDTRMGALTFLDKSKNADLVLKGNIGDFSMSLYSEDTKEAELADRVSRRYN